MGTICKRKDGRWTGATYVYVNGVKKRKYVYANTERECKRLLNELEYLNSVGQYKEQNRESFLNYANKYYIMKEKTWQDTTKELYRMYIDVHLKDYFDNIRICDITPDMLTKYYNSKLDGGLSNNTVRKLHVFIKSIMNNALKNDIIKKNPCYNADVPRKEKYMPNIYNKDKFKMLLEKVQGTDDEIPIVLAAGCGMRRGEVFGLTWGNIDFSNGTITISSTKTRFKHDIEKGTKNESSERTIKAPTYILEMLSRYKKGVVKDSDAVITKWKPQPYSEHFKKLLEKNGLEVIRFHDLRHFNAVVMMMDGISDKVAAERLGHSQVKTLREVYQHVLEDADIEAANKLNDMF